MLKKQPWLREENCPEYRKYRKIDNIINEIKRVISDIFGLLSFIFISIFIGATFGFGLWYEFKLIFNYLF
jgi:hypothetical protein